MSLFKQKLKSILIITVLSFAIAACSAFDSNSNHGSGEPKNLGQPTAPTSGVACYPGGCLSTISYDGIVDPNHDYHYQDPATFPTQSLRGQYIAPNMMIDLKGLDMKMPIAPSFVMGDILNVDHGRYGVFSAAVLSTIQKMRDELNKAIYITSGFRSPGRNSQTDGSAQWSRHMYGDALDFSTDAADYKSLQKLCQQHGASFTLIYKSHIHCDWRLSPLDPAFYGSVPPPPIAAQDVEAVASDISSKSSIVELSRNFRTITLGARIVELEDEGDLSYDWVVILPDQSEYLSIASKIELPRLTGLYKIKLTVGGSIEIERQLQIK